MKQYASKEEAKPYIKLCRSILDIAEEEIEEEIKVQKITLIGSAGRNMITKDKNGIFDLDYNIFIKDIKGVKIKEIKQIITNAVNNAIKEKGLKYEFSGGKDSTSAITYIMYSPKNKIKKFSFDVGIISRNRNGEYQRLIHDKQNVRYYWNKLPDISELKDKEYDIKHFIEIAKEDGVKYKPFDPWKMVRDRYLEKKNDYISIRDNNHPSFVVYIETINEIYNELITCLEKDKQ